MRGRLLAAKDGSLYEALWPAPSSFFSCIDIFSWLAVSHARSSSSIFLRGNVLSAAPRHVMAHALHYLLDDAGVLVAAESQRGVLVEGGGVRKRCCICRRRRDLQSLCQCCRARLRGGSILAAAA